MVELMNILLGLCAFLATLKLLKLLRFHPKVNYISAAIESSKSDLLSFSVVFVLIWFAFVQLMYLFYNEKSVGFSSVLRTMLTCFQIILGKFELADILQVSSCSRVFF